MLSTPLVTVICLCYNHESFVIESLESVVNQHYKNIQIIVVDDHSSDNSVLVIEKWLKNHPGIIFIKNPQNLGNTKAFNQATKLAHGSFLIDLACDDLLLPNCIEIQIKSYFKNKTSNIGIVFGNAENIDKNGNYISDHFKTDNYKNVLDKSLFKTTLLTVLAGGNTINSVSAMINKTVFDELNGYDESLAFEDLDFWIRVLEKYQIVFIDEIITQKRDLKTSLGNQFFKKNKTANRVDSSMNKIYSNVIVKYKSNPEILKAVLKRIHYSVDHSIKNKKYKFVALFGLQKLKIHFHLLFSK